MKKHKQISNKKDRKTKLSKHFTVYDGDMSRRNKLYLIQGYFKDVGNYSKDISSIVGDLIDAYMDHLETNKPQKYDLTTFHKPT